MPAKRSPPAPEGSNGDSAAHMSQEQPPCDADASRAAKHRRIDSPPGGCGGQESVSDSGSKVGGAPGGCTWLIAVHGGAAQGFFTPSLRKKYSASLTAACERASAALRRGEKADEAVRIAIACLEDDATTNAGTGSNLTMDGVVECDACIVDGRHGDSGGAGAVQGVKNPIDLAHAIMRNASLGLQDLGLVPPTLLCGAGARSFARDRGLPVSHADGDR
ncbi:nucleophile aminohydrolase, partial [Baffinella frigidus]